MSRDEISRRFRNIQASVEEIHGADAAFAAASVGWLRAIQYGIQRALLRLCREAEGAEQLDRMHALTSQLEDEIQKMLQGYHAELCQHLRVDEGLAYQLSKHFEEVTKSICKGE